MKYFIFLFLLAFSAMAATTGNITLQGVVPAVVSVTVTGQGTYNALDLTTTQTNLTVANVQEQSNDGLGYKVTAASTNSGQLKNGAIDQVTYTAKYNGTSFTLSSTAVTVTTQGAQAVIVNVTKPLTISYIGTPNVSLMSGTYSDTLTFTIVAN